MAGANLLFYFKIDAVYLSFVFNHEFPVMSSRTRGMDQIKHPGADSIPLTFILALKES